jgi:hypothetical protein
VSRYGTILVVLSLLTGLAVSFSIAGSEQILTCQDNGRSYARHSRGFPLKFTHAKLDIPACRHFKGPRCAVAVCDNFGGLKEERSVRPLPLVADMAVWGLFAAGILYMASAFIIKT